MLVWVSYAKKPVPMSSFFLFIAGCSRRIQYASSIRRRRPSRVEQSTLADLSQKVKFGESSPLTVDVCLVLGLDLKSSHHVTMCAVH